MLCFFLFSFLCQSQSKLIVIPISTVATRYVAFSTLLTSSVFYQLHHLKGVLSVEEPNLSSLRNVEKIEGDQLVI